MTEEQKFWSLIKDHLPGDVCRIENTTGSGVPDVSGCIYPVDYWVELKVCDNKKKYADITKLLRDSQCVWCYRRMFYNKNSKIFVAVKYVQMKRILVYKYNKLYSFEIISNTPFNNGYNWQEIKTALEIHLKG